MFAVQIVFMVCSSVYFIWFQEHPEPIKHSHHGLDGGSGSDVEDVCSSGASDGSDNEGSDNESSDRGSGGSSIDETTDAGGSNSSDMDRSNMALGSKQARNTGRGNFKTSARHIRPAHCAPPIFSTPCTAGPCNNAICARQPTLHAMVLLANGGQIGTG